MQSQKLPKTTLPLTAAQLQQIALAKAAQRAQEYQTLRTGYLQRLAELEAFYDAELKPTALPLVPLAPPEPHPVLSFFQDGPNEYFKEFNRVQYNLDSSDDLLIQLKTVIQLMDDLIALQKAILLHKQNKDVWYQAGCVVWEDTTRLAQHLFYQYMKDPYDDHKSYPDAVSSQTYILQAESFNKTLHAAAALLQATPNTLSTSAQNLLDEAAKMQQYMERNIPLAAEKKEFPFDRALAGILILVGLGVIAASLYMAAAFIFPFALAGIPFFIAGCISLAGAYIIYEPTKPEKSKIQNDLQQNLAQSAAQANQSAKNLGLVVKTGMFSGRNANGTQPSPNGPGSGLKIGK